MIAAIKWKETFRSVVLLRRGGNFIFVMCFITFILCVATPRSLWALACLGDPLYACLEDPTESSFQSGIGLIRGWACQANLIEIQIDEGPRLRVAYGTTRADTQKVCGDEDNGFGLTWNWNRSGDGEHQVRAYIDGMLFGDVKFSVVTMGEEFLRGARGTFILSGFPRHQENVTVRWDETLQNFVITEHHLIQEGIYGLPSNPLPDSVRAIVRHPTRPEDRFAQVLGWGHAMTLSQHPIGPATITLDWIRLIEGNPETGAVITEKNYDDAVPRSLTLSEGGLFDRIPMWYGTNNNTPINNSLIKDGYLVINMAPTPNKIAHWWTDRITTKPGVRYYIIARIKLDGDVGLQLGSDYWEVGQSNPSKYPNDQNRRCDSRICDNNCNNCEAWLSSWYGNTSGEFIVITAPIQ